MHGNKTLAITVSVGFYDVCLMVTVESVGSLFHGPEWPLLFLHLCFRYSGELCGNGIRRIYKYNQKTKNVGQFERCVFLLLLLLLFFYKYSK